MRDFNQAIVSGRIARDIEVRTTPSGVPVADLTVANNRKTSGGKEDSVFLRCTVWSATASWAAENLKVGDTVMITGHLVSDDFTTKETGQRTKGRVRIDNCQVTLLKKKGQSNQVVEETITEDND